MGKLIGARGAHCGIFVMTLVLAGCGGEEPQETLFEESVAGEEAALSFARFCLSQCSDRGDRPRIIRCDDRTQGPTTQSGAQNAPWRHVGRLSTGCTGTLIGPRHVLTAAHCFSGAPSSPVGFTLARYGDNECPYGTHYARTIYVPAEYLPNSDSPQDKALDYAVVELENPIPDASPMHFEYLSWPTIRHRAQHSIGYAGDKPHGTVWQTGTNYFYDGPYRWLDGGERGLLYVNNDGAGGQSGSPVYIFHQGVRTVVGVLIGGTVAECRKGRNWAARLTPGAVERIENTMATPLTIDFSWTMWESPPAADIEGCHDGGISGGFE